MVEDKFLAITDDVKLGVLSDTAQNTNGAMSPEEHKIKEKMEKSMENYQLLQVE